MKAADVTVKLDAGSCRVLVIEATGNAETIRGVVASMIEAFEVGRPQVMPLEQSDPKETA